MIKPDTLWSFLKRSEDGSEMTVGRVCRSLAGHNVRPPLTESERLLLGMISESNEWHTKAVESERKRKRDWAARAREKAFTPAPFADGVSTIVHSRLQASTPENSDHPSVRPSVRPSIRPSVHPSERDIPPSIPPSGDVGGALAARFDRFWAEYPRKQSKKDAAAKFGRLFKGLSEDAATGLFERIMRSLAAHRTSDQWVRDDGRYIPFPATWLNQARWDDELAAGGSGADAKEMAEFERQRRDEARRLKEKALAAATVVEGEGGGE